MKQRIVNEIMQRDQASERRRVGRVVAEQRRMVISGVGSRDVARVMSADNALTEGVSSCVHDGLEPAMTTFAARLSESFENAMARKLNEMRIPNDMGPTWTRQDVRAILEDVNARDSAEADLRNALTEAIDTYVNGLAHSLQESYLDGLG